MSQRDPLTMLVAAGALGVGAYVLLRPAASATVEQSAAVDAAAGASNEASRHMLTPAPAAAGPAPAQANREADRAAAAAGFSWEWSREVAAPIDFATGTHATVRDRGAVSRVVTFAGYDVLNRAAQWRSSRTTVARIPWDTKPSDYDWTGGTPSPADAKRPPQPDAVDRLLSGAAIAGSVVLGQNPRDPKPWEDPGRWLRGVIGLPQ